MAVQASVGFGFGFFVAPAALGVLRAAQAVTLLLLLGLVINTLILYAEGRERELDARAGGLLCAAALPGIAAGTLLVKHLPGHVLQVAIGVGIIAAALLQATTLGSADGERPPSGRTRTLAGGGSIAGFFTTATSLNGPAVVLTLARAGLRAHVLRDTGAAVFLVLNVIGATVLVLIAHSGRGLPHWPLLVAMLPAVAAGHRAGAALFTRLDARRHTRLVLAAAVVAGTVSIVAGLA